MCNSARMNPHITVCPYHALTEPSSEGQDNEGAGEGIPYRNSIFCLCLKGPGMVKCQKI